MQRLALTILAVSSAIACKPEKDKDKDKSTPAETKTGSKAANSRDAVTDEWYKGMTAQVSSKDFEVGKKIKLTPKDKLIAKLQDSNFLTNTDEEEEETEFGRCLNDKVRTSKFKLKGQVANYQFSGDLAECDKSGNTSKMSFTLSFSIACEHGDLEKLDGLTMDEATKKFRGTATLCDDGKVASASKSELVGADQGQTDKGQSFAREYVSVTVNGNQDGGPCLGTAKDGITTATGCVELYNFKVTKFVLEGEPIPEQLVSDYFKVESRGIEARDDEPWYSAGSMQVDVNGWKGEVSYQDGKTPPQYELKSKDGKETAAGKLTKKTKDKSQLNLNDSNQPQEQQILRLMRRMPGF